MTRKIFIYSVFLFLLFSVPQNLCKESASDFQENFQDNVIDDDFGFEFSDVTDEIDFEEIEEPGFQ